MVPSRIITFLRVEGGWKGQWGRLRKEWRDKGETSGGMEGGEAGGECNLREREVGVTRSRGEGCCVLKERG
jgi:hypothetical protein